MDNLVQEELKLHEGHDDDFDEEDEGAMDENHPMWRRSGSRSIRSASTSVLRHPI